MLIEIDETVSHFPLAMVIVIVDMAFSCFVISLTLYHSWLIAKGITTYEHTKNRVGISHYFRCRL